MNLVFVCFVILLNCFNFCESKLDCPPLPPHSPKNINDLRPNDIKVVMALGDSITAAFGLMGAKGEFNEYRGLSWCIGGDENATTIPNFLLTYVPEVVGASVGHHIVEDCTGPNCLPFQYHPKIDQFNAAQSGAMIMNLPLHEMDYLLEQVLRNPNVDVANDWKMLTILIGANDICKCCSTNASYTGPEAFEQDLVAVLEKVRVTLPRTFVNLILGFNLSEVYNLGRKSIACELKQRLFSWECGCIFHKGANATRVEVDAIAQQYNQRIFKIQDLYRSKNFTDFAVVAHPFMYRTNLDTFPLDFLSTLDCFHPSLFAHENLAVALWNSMLTPAAQKKTQLTIGDKPICPTSNTLLYTN